MTLSDLAIFQLEWDDEKLAALAANNGQVDQAQTEKLALEALGRKDPPAPSPVSTDRAFTRPVRVKFENHTKEVPVFYTARTEDSLSKLASQINTSHAAAKAAAKSTLQHAIKCGAFLHDAKGRVKHGQWLPWLRDHCPEISERMAQSYMRLHDRRAELKSETGFVFEGTIKHALSKLKRPPAVPKAEAEGTEGDKRGSEGTTSVFDGASAVAVHQALELFFTSFRMTMDRFMQSGPSNNDCNAVVALLTSAQDALGGFSHELGVDGNLRQSPEFRAFETSFGPEG